MIITLGKRAFQRRGQRICYVELYDNVQLMIGYAISRKGMKRARQNAVRALRKAIAQRETPSGPF